MLAWSHTTPPEHPNQHLSALNNQHWSCWSSEAGSHFRPSAFYFLLAGLIDPDATNIIREELQWGDGGRRTRLSFHGELICADAR